MPRKYGSPRYQQSTRPGRKPLPPQARRKLIAARVAPETYQYLRDQKTKLGLLIDQLVKKEQQLSTTSDIDNPELFNNEQDVIIEQARGLIALLIERGTQHLTEEQIELLSANFSLLINNYIATFKKRTKVTEQPWLSKISS